MNEHEVRSYHRLYREFRRNFLFAGKPKLEQRFGLLTSWFIRKAAYCLEEYSYIARPFREWKTSHSTDRYLQIEDDFFLPFIFEKLKDEFGDKVIKKPEKFKGEIDIFFDGDIPIELKIREADSPLDLSSSANIIGEKQAAFYASISRIAFLIILDLPVSDRGSLRNLESCVKGVILDQTGSSGFPTCVAVIRFDCHHGRPSSFQ